MTGNYFYFIFFSLCALDWKHNPLSLSLVLNFTILLNLGLLLFNFGMLNTFKIQEIYTYACAPTFHFWFQTLRFINLNWCILLIHGLDLDHRWMFVCNANIYTPQEETQREGECIFFVSRMDLKLISEFGGQNLCTLDVRKVFCLREKEVWSRLLPILCDQVDAFVNSSMICNGAFYFLKGHLSHTSKVYFISLQYLF